jgi:hypothetical protein
MTKTLLLFIIGGAAVLALSVALENRRDVVAPEQLVWSQPPVDYPLQPKKKKAMEWMRPVGVAWSQPPVDYPLQPKKKKAMETLSRPIV